MKTKTATCAAVLTMLIALAVACGGVQEQQDVTGQDVTGQKSQAVMCASCDVGGGGGGGATACDTCAVGGACYNRLKTCDAYRDFWPKFFCLLNVAASYPECEKCIDGTC